MRRLERIVPEPRECAVRLIRRTASGCVVPFLRRGPTRGSDRTAIGGRREIDAEPVFLQMAAASSLRGMRLGANLGSRLRDHR